jgi:hypothetical protein
MIRTHVWVMTLSIPLLAGCASRPQELPHSLGSLTLERYVGGDEAKNIIDHLHGKPVSTESNLMADEEAMSRLISGGNGLFTHYHQLEIQGRRVAMCLGMGQVHYFFSRGSTLYWLAVDSRIAQETLAALLQGVDG